MENTVTVQPTALKPSLVKTTEFELERYRLILTEMLLCRKSANIYVKTEQFTLDVKDTTKTANIKMVVLQSWHIFTTTRTFRGKIR